VTIVIAFIAGMLLVASPALAAVARVYASTNRALSKADEKYSEARRLFDNARTLRSDEERVAELAFYAWSLERRCDAAVHELARLEGAAARARRVPRLLWALAAVGAAAIVLVALRWVG
jgi:hypothetical protein